MAERGEKDCVLCDVDLGIGHLSVVCIGPERHGQAVVSGCCAQCLRSLGFEAAAQAMGEAFTDDCYGGGGPLDVHVGSNTVQ